MNDIEIKGMQIRICNACKQYKKCDNELCTMSELVAKELCRFYQPKITENSVILTKEELNENYTLIDTLVQCKEELEFIKRRNADTNEKIASEIADYVAKARKETIEKIFRELLKDIIEINERNKQGLLIDTYYCVGLDHIKKVATDVGFEFELENKE